MVLQLNTLVSPFLQCAMLWCEWIDYGIYPMLLVSHGYIYRYG